MATVISSAQLMDVLECPVCDKTVLPPVLQCSHGHLVCSVCHALLSTCPVCREPLGYIRNLALERVASQIMLPCKHANEGCDASLEYAAKAEHDRTCKFNPDYFKILGEGSFLRGQAIHSRRISARTPNE